MRQRKKRTMKMPWTFKRRQHHRNLRACWQGFTSAGPDAGISNGGGAKRGGSHVAATLELVSPDGLVGHSFGVFEYRLPVAGHIMIPPQVYGQAINASDVALRDGDIAVAHNIKNRR